MTTKKKPDQALYFSEHELGQRPRNSEKIGDEVWLAIRSLILSRVHSGWFGAGYPKTCDDGPVAVGCDWAGMRAAMAAEIPGIPPRAWWSEDIQTPRTLQVLDMIQFCWRAVGRPQDLGYHKFFMHSHMTFSVESGRREFREDVERIFRRSGLAYTLTERGTIERVVPHEFRNLVSEQPAKTGDDELDRLLETARRKFLDPKDPARREALESLWDAWERLKTMGEGPDKKTQATDLLQRAATSSSSKFYKRLQNEATVLTEIGNDSRIRHSERTQERLSRSEHIDYLFYRLMALIKMILSIVQPGKRLIAVIAPLGIGTVTASAAPISTALTWAPT